MTSHGRTRSVRVGGLFVLATSIFGACYDAHGDGDASLLPDAGPDAGPVIVPPPPPTGEVDLLFVIDNSGSLGEEQVKLWYELPNLMVRLASGDIDLDGVPDRAPLRDLHVGVVTTDMGTGGFVVPTCADADFGDDGRLRSQGNTGAGCPATFPPFLAFLAGGADAPERFAADVACVAVAGTGGCGFEQQLEAGLKALSPVGPTAWTAPGYEAPTFFRGTTGHGDIAGFIRADSVLAIVMLSDEDDCSARDPEIFNPASATYGATDLNLRCFAHEDAALHPVSRYVDGLLQLRRSPGRLVFAPIVGVPQDLEPGLGEAPDWELLTSPDPMVRDYRLQNRVDPSMPTRLLASCTGTDPSHGAAYPPSRILQTARGLDARGARVVLGSICDLAYDGVMQAIADAILR